MSYLHSLDTLLRRSSSRNNDEGEANLFGMSVDRNIVLGYEIEKQLTHM